MIKKLKKLSGWVSFLKAEYAEAQVFSYTFILHTVQYVYLYVSTLSL